MESSGAFPEIPELNGVPEDDASNPQFKFGKRGATINGLATEIFTLSLNGETTTLLPLKTWSQLDVHKWRARGKLPGTPTGLEIALDHIKLMGETIYPGEPGACARLDKLFADWLKVETERLELLKKQADSKATSPPPDPVPAVEQQTQRFEVEVDTKGQVKVHCVQGKAIAATIGLTTAGFQSLVDQRLMRKPRSVKTGVLHDWVELDGVLYSFKDGKNDSEKLARALNGNFLPGTAFGEEESIVVLGNAATATGLELQFAARVAGVPDHHRRPLDQATLELLQDPERCGLLQPGIIVKLAAPHIIFKRRTADGGEQYLPSGPDTLIKVQRRNGEQTFVDISKPLDYMRLGPKELTAAFNHPLINKIQRSDASENNRQPTPVSPPADVTQAPATKTGPPAEKAFASPPQDLSAPQATKPAAEIKPPAGEKPLPNVWLKPVLEQPTLDHTWLTWLLYQKLAAYVGDSEQTKLNGCDAWLIALGDELNPYAHGFRGIFLIQNCCLGYMGRGFLAQFETGSLLLGAQHKQFQLMGVKLVAVGLDANDHLVFITQNEIRAKSAQAALSGLRGLGVTIKGIKDVLDSDLALHTVWTVPAEQANLEEPQALESRSPNSPVRVPKVSRRAGEQTRQAA